MARDFGRRKPAWEYKTADEMTDSELEDCMNSCKRMDAAVRALKMEFEYGRAFPEQIRAARNTYGALTEAEYAAVVSIVHTSIEQGIWKYNPEKALETSRVHACRMAVEYKYKWLSLYGTEFRDPEEDNIH